VSSTTTSGNRLRVRMIGNTIIISRATSPGFGNMEVYVDGILHSTVSNESSTGNSVPYVITGLNPVEHLVEIVNTGTQLTIDSIRSLNVGILSTIKTDNTSSLLLYSNQWTREANTLTYLSSVHDTVDPTAAVSFYMRANWFCIGYSQQPGGGNMEVSINGEPYTTIATANALTSHQKEWCSGVIPNDVHYVDVQISGGPVELDYVFPKLYNTITPARRVVQENDPAMIYSGTWYTLTGFRSTGGFLGQGSTLRYTETDGASVRFFINGTGLIIYTSIGPIAGDIEVFVDGVQQNVMLWNYVYSSMILYDSRTRPYAYAITDLPPGIHEIELRARIDNFKEKPYPNFAAIPGYQGQWYVDFDAVRVFP
jgi:hypothetical protein